MRLPALRDVPQVAEMLCRDCNSRFSRCILELVSS